MSEKTKVSKQDSSGHIPVLLQDVLTQLSPEVISANRDPNVDWTTQSFRYLDGTFGRGGHLHALLEKYPQASAVACDQDPDAIAYANENFAPWIASGRLQMIHKNFAELDWSSW